MTITQREKTHRYANDVAQEATAGLPRRTEQEGRHLEATSIILHRLADLINEEIDGNDTVMTTVYQTALRIAEDQINRSKSIEDMLPKIELLAARVNNGSLLDPKR